MDIGAGCQGPGAGAEEDTMCLGLYGFADFQQITNAGLRRKLFYVKIRVKQKK